MRYKLKCKECPATCWVRGDYDPSVNALELDDKHEYEWDEEHCGRGCKHQDFDVVDQEAEEFEDACI